MKFIFSLLLAVIVGSLSCSAADLDSFDYYSLAPVQPLSPTVNSALDYAVQPLDLSTDESNWLKGIYQTLVNSSYMNSDSIRTVLFNIRTYLLNLYNSGFITDISDIRDAFYLNKSAVDGSIVASVKDITTIRDALLGASGSLSQPATHSIFYYIYNLAQLPEIKSDLQNIENNTNYLDNIWGDTDSLNSIFSDDYEVAARNPSNQLMSYTDNFRGQLGKLVNSLATDGYNVGVGNRTLYGRLKQLQLVLAPDTDLALSVSQEANREFVDNSFFSGSSGSTSLGVSDFGDLADIGGTLKDSLSLDGNATIGSFTSGLTAADTAGQGWFSEETRSQLDAVSSTVTYSLRDPDPYNMSGWEDRYYWLLGDDAS